MKIKLLIIFLLSFISCSCYNYHELNELAIVSAYGLDIKEDKYLLTVQIISTVKEGSDTNAAGNRSKFLNYDVEADTIEEAFRNILLESPKKLFTEHLSILVIGDALAKDGIDDILDLAFRDSEFRKQFQVAIAKDDTANNLLKTITPLESINAKSISEMLKTNSTYLGTVIPTTYEDLLKVYLSKKEDLYIPAIQIYNKGDNDDVDTLKESTINSNVLIAGMGIFKDSKLIDYLEPNESKYLNFLKNKIKNTMVTFKCDKTNLITIEILSSKANINIKNNKLIFDIRGKANINEINCKMDLTDEKSIKKLQKELNGIIRNNINNMIDKTVFALKVDVLGYEKIYYQKNYDFYQKNKNDLNIEFIVKTNFLIEEKGHGIKEVK